ncbi:MAG TPA: hypothetical protein VM123_19965 [archaeon]|nr:hypothetical protein [archaeon]
MDLILDWLNQNTSIIGLLLSLSAIAVSIWAYSKSSKTEKKLLEIEEAREEDRIKQSKKAILMAIIDHEYHRNFTSFTLQIKNEGEAEARDVCVKLDEMPLLEHPVIPKTIEEIKQIGPKSVIRYRMAITRGYRKNFEVEITWADDSGEPGFYKTTLTL